MGNPSGCDGYHRPLASECTILTRLAESWRPAKAEARRAESLKRRKKVNMYSHGIRLLAMVFLVIPALGGGETATPNSKPDTATKTEIRRVPATYTNPASGKEMFKSYCASCHGEDAKGSGPAAPALKTPPADLTALAAKNGGKYPEEHVATVIQGDALMPAHGAKDMPVWGPVFLSLGQHSQAEAHLRIRNLVKYVGTLQVK